MRRLIAMTALLALSGCNGHLREFADNSNYPTDKSLEGIRIYMPALMKVTLQTTTFTDDKTMKLSYACNHVSSVQIRSMADYTQPLRIYYEPGLFETVTFGVTLYPDGSLNVVNGNGTPAGASLLSSAGPIIAGVAAISAAAPAGAATQPAVTAGGLPNCTSDPVMVKIEKCPQQEGTIVCEAK